MCAEGNLELWERIQSSGYDGGAGKLTTWLYPFLRGRMYRYLETNLGVMALSKDEMARVRLAQRLYHTEDKSVEEIAAQMGISERAAARLVGYNTHFLSVFDLQKEDEEGDPLERLLAQPAGSVRRADRLPEGVSGAAGAAVPVTERQRTAPSWATPSASTATKNCPPTSWACGRCSPPTGSQRPERQL